MFVFYAPLMFRSYTNERKKVLCWFVKSLNESCVSLFSVANSPRYKKVASSARYETEQKKRKKQGFCEITFYMSNQDFCAVKCVIIIYK